MFLSRVDYDTIPNESCPLVFLFVNFHLNLSYHFQMSIELYVCFICLFKWSTFFLILLYHVHYIILFVFLIFYFFFVCACLRYSIAKAHIYNLYLLHNILLLIVIVHLRQRAKLKTKLESFQKDVKRFFFLKHISGCCFESVEVRDPMKLDRVDEGRISAQLLGLINAYEIDFSSEFAGILIGVCDCSFMLRARAEKQTNTNQI